jgi:hypothetical protein
MLLRRVVGMFLGVFTSCVKSLSFLLISAHLMCERFQAFLLTEFGRSFKLYLDMIKKESDVRGLVFELEKRNFDLKKENFGLKNELESFKNLFFGY